MQAMQDAKHCPLLTTKGLYFLVRFFFKKHQPDTQNLLVCIEVAPRSFTRAQGLHMYGAIFAT